MNQILQFDRAYLFSSIDFSIELKELEQIEEISGQIDNKVMKVANKRQVSR